MLSFTKVREYSGHRDALYTLCKAARPGYFFAAGAEKIIAEWQSGNAEGRAFAETEGPVYALHCDAEREILAAGLATGGVVFIDASTRKPASATKGHEQGVFDFCPAGGEYLFACSGGGEISAWNLHTFKKEESVRVAKGSIRTLIAAPGGGFLAGASDSHIYLLDASLKVLKSWPGHSPSVFRLLLSPDGKWLYSAGRDAHIRMWETKNYLCVKEIAAHMFAINDLVLHPSRNWIFSGSMDKSIRLWDAENLMLLKVADAARHGCHRNGVNRLAWVADKLMSCGDDRLIMEWEAGEVSQENA